LPFLALSRPGPGKSTYILRDTNNGGYDTPYHAGKKLLSHIDQRQASIFIFLVAKSTLQVSLIALRPNFSTNKIPYYDEEEDKNEIQKNAETSEGKGENRIITDVIINNNYCVRCRSFGTGCDCQNIQLFSQYFLRGVCAPIVVVIHFVVEEKINDFIEKKLCIIRLNTQVQSQQRSGTLEEETR